MKGVGEKRIYVPGEDRLYPGVVCQGPGPHVSRLRRGICGLKNLTKEPRAKLPGSGWWDVYRCPAGHRFAVRAQTPTNARPEGTASFTRYVIDIPTEKPVFGNPHPF